LDGKGHLAGGRRLSGPSLETLASPTGAPARSFIIPAAVFIVNTPGSKPPASVEVCL